MSTTHGTAPQQSVRPQTPPALRLRDCWKAPLKDRKSSGISSCLGILAKAPGEARRSPHVPERNYWLRPHRTY